MPTNKHGEKNGYKSFGFHPHVNDGDFPPGGMLKRERAEIVLQFIHEILNGKTDTLLYERIYLLNNRSSSNH